MNLKAFSSLLLGLLLALLAAYFAYQKNQSERLLAGMFARQAVLRRDLLREEGLANRAESDRARLTAEAKKLESKASPPPPAQPQVRPKRLNLWDVMKKHPEVQIAFIESRRAVNARIYRELYHSLGLTSEQSFRLTNIMVDQVTALNDLAAAVDALGHTTKDPEYAAVAMQIDREAEAAEVVLLGAAGLSQLQEYTRTLPARDLVTKLAVTLASTEPINAQQADQLAHLVAQAVNPSDQTGMNVYTVGLDWTLVDRQSAKILTPSQLAVWRNNPSRLRTQLQATFNEAAKK
jgi:hypothetical protein